MVDEIMFNWAAKRASEDPTFLGYHLQEYRKMNGLDETALTRFLECPHDSLTKLALCLHPDPHTGSFRDNVERIAVHCAANPLKLAQLIREVDSVQTMRSASAFVVPKVPGQSAVLLAARDRTRPPHRKQKTNVKKKKRPKSK